MGGIGLRILTAAALTLMLAALALWALPRLLSPTPGARDDLDSCAHHFGDVGIAACTRAIASGSKQGRELARLYGNRCFKYKVKDRPDLAIADCDAAIRLDPNFAQAFNIRGLAYRDKGDFDRAIADYSETIRLDPGYAPAYHNRGMARRAKGYTADADADLDAARRLDPELGRLLGGAR